MSLGDVLLLFGTLLALGIALPGMLLAWSLLFPATVNRACARLHSSLWRCFWRGALWLVLGGLLIAVLLGAPSGLTKLLGWLLLFLALALSSIGVAGLAALLGQRLRASGLATSSVGAMLRGAVAFELAVVFPLIGWFVVLPVALICALGAAMPALRRRSALARLTEGGHASNPS